MRRKLEFFKILLQQIKTPGNALIYPNFNGATFVAKHCNPHPQSSPQSQTGGKKIKFEHVAMKPKLC